MSGPAARPSPWTVRGLARAAAVVAVLGIFSRALGFVRELILAAIYGTSAATDAFVNALLVVNAVAAILLYTLVTLVIPVFQQERERAGSASAWRLLWAIAAWSGIVLIGVSVLITVWPEGPTALFNLDPGRAHTTERLLRLMAPALALQGLSALFTALLQIHARFALPAAVGVAFNLGIIVAVTIGHGSIGIDAAGIGVSVGALLQIALQTPQFLRLARAEGVRVTLRHERLRYAGLMALPVLGASLLQQINSFTDKFFASSLVAGRVAALNFANALGSAPRTALLFPLLTPLFPLIARMMAEKRSGDAQRAFERAAGLLALVAIPMSALIALYAHEVATITFGHGKCGGAAGADCRQQIGAPLAFYGLAVWGNFLGYLLNRALSAANRFADVVIATTIAVVVTIGLDIALIGPLEQGGLALASAIGVYLNVVITLLFLRRQLPGLSLRALAHQQGRLLLCGGLAAGAAALLNLAVPGSTDGTLAAAWPLAIKALAAIVVYVAALRLLAPAELAEARRSLRAFIPRRWRPA
jgi:putative peptidoglycan lipid II flippase